jgi:AcrR family transcriptional regulator
MMPIPTSSRLRDALEAITAQPAPRSDVQARDRRVMAAVLIECAQHGSTNARVVDIAKRARVSTATLYREYGDRDAVFSRALELGLTLLPRIWRPLPLPEEPLARLEALLKSHASFWSNPFIGWLIRMYVQYGNGKAPHLLALGRADRETSLAYWGQQIEGLVQEGFLVAGHTNTILNIILGAIERRTIFARLGFGEKDDHEPKIEDVINHTSMAIFQVFGTEQFWSSRKDQRSAGWCGDGRPAFETGPELANDSQNFWAVGEPQALLDLPSKRLAAYAERVLAQDHSRLDIAGRRTRIQLATMLECSDKGYEAVGMADIAARAKVSTATLYLDYADKEGLFLDVMLLQARLKLDYARLIGNVRFQDAICNITFSIARVLADPKFLWFHYVSMASDLSQTPELIAYSRETRDHTEGFWKDYFRDLISRGILGPFDETLAMNLLLGATQRRSVQALVLYGVEDTDEEQIAHLAKISTEFLLRLVGPGPANAC